MEHYVHMPMTGDELDVAIAALELYARELIKSAGYTSTSAAIARETARIMRLARRELP